MKKYTYILYLLLISFTQNIFSQQTPAPKQTKTISIVGATAHVGNGTIIEKSIIIFKNGIIKYIGPVSNQKAIGEVIEAYGKHIYPGFIIPNSTLGLGEIDAVRATRDFDETGMFIPNVRSLIAYNTESQVVESVRPNGVLLAQITPRGGIISGSSSIVQLDAWNWEDAAIKFDDGIHINWPKSFKTKNLSFGRSKYSMINKDYADNISELKNYFVQIKNYDQKLNKERNLSFEASKKLFTGEKILYIHVDLQKEILDAIDFAEDIGIKNIVLVGAYEAYKVSNILKNKNIPVLLQRVHSLPKSVDDDYDLPYKLAALLTKNGVLVGLQADGQMERMNSRNLPFYAGTVTGYGLNNEEALQLITLNTAKILGIDKNYGSLEEGKSATLFISEGNALDMRTNILTKAFINGRKISLETHQTELYKKYTDKYKNK